MALEFSGFGLLLVTSLEVDELELVPVLVSPEVSEVPLDVFEVSFDVSEVTLEISEVPLLLESEIEG